MWTIISTVVEILTSRQDRKKQEQSITFYKLSVAGRLAMEKVTMDHPATLAKLQVLADTRDRLNTELNTIFENILQNLFKNEEDVVNENALLTKEISTLLCSYHSKLVEIGKSSNVKRKIYDGVNYPLITVVNNIMKLTLSYNQGKVSDIDNSNHSWEMLHAYIHNPDDSFRDIPVTARITLKTWDK